jgi:hypothetical protein
MDKNRKMNSNFSQWKSYINLLERKPLVTKCVTGGVLAFSADLVCQYGEQQRLGHRLSDNFDSLRSARFTALGALLVSPTLHYWYGYLGRAVPGTTARDAMKRLFHDQVFFAPAFIPTFFFANLLLEGKPEEFVDKVKQDLLSTVVTNYIVWIPAQFVNFRYIPPNLQVLFSNTIGFFWNIFLSYMANRSVGDVPQEDAEAVAIAIKEKEKISEFISAVSSGIKLGREAAPAVPSKPEIASSDDKEDIESQQVGDNDSPVNVSESGTDSASSEAEPTEFESSQTVVEDSDNILETDVIRDAVREEEQEVEYNGEPEQSSEGSSDPVTDNTETGKEDADDGSGSENSVSEVTKETSNVVVEGKDSVEASAGEDEDDGRE